MTETDIMPLCRALGDDPQRAQAWLPCH
jgi:hypothetical protein